VGLLALIAGTVSNLHMHLLVELPSVSPAGWRRWMSVDGMIVAASTTLLADSRAGSQGGYLPRALLVIFSSASLGANVAVAEPTTTGRVITARPSFSLIAAYELLMRQVRRVAQDAGPRQLARRSPGRAVMAAVAREPVPAGGILTPDRRMAGRDMQREAGEPGRGRLAAVGQGHREPIRSA
jgi:Protein of unknown function (DUF2637)